MQGFYFINVAFYAPISDKGIFLGYADDSKAYRVYNKVSKILMITANVTIDDASISNVSVPNISVEQTSKDFMYLDVNEEGKSDQASLESDMARKDVDNVSHEIDETLAIQGQNRPGNVKFKRIIRRMTSLAVRMMV